jgi:hypothetical protein
MKYGTTGWITLVTIEVRLKRETDKWNLVFKSILTILPAVKWWDLKFKQTSWLRSAVDSLCFCIMFTNAIHCLLCSLLPPFQFLTMWILRHNATEATKWFIIRLHFVGDIRIISSFEQLPTHLALNICPIYMCNLFPPNWSPFLRTMK